MSRKNAVCKEDFSRLVAENANKIRDYDIPLSCVKSTEKSNKFKSKGDELFADKKYRDAVLIYNLVRNYGISSSSDFLLSSRPFFTRLKLQPVSTVVTGVTEVSVRTNKRSEIWKVLVNWDSHCLKKNLISSRLLKSLVNRTSDLASI